MILSWINRDVVDKPSRGGITNPRATTIHPTTLDRVTKYHCLREVARANIQYSLAEVTVSQRLLVLDKILPDSCMLRDIPWTYGSHFTVDQYRINIPFKRGNRSHSPFKEDFDLGIYL